MKKIESKIKDVDGKYYASAYLDDKFKKTQFEVIIGEYHKERHSQFWETKKWVLRGMFLNDVFQVTSMSAIPYRYTPKKSAVNKFKEVDNDRETR